MLKANAKANITESPGEKKLSFACLKFLVA